MNVLKKERADKGNTKVNLHIVLFMKDVLY